MDGCYCACLIRKENYRDLIQKDLLQSDSLKW